MPTNIFYVILLIESLSNNLMHAFKLIWNSEYMHEAKKGISWNVLVVGSLEKRENSCLLVSPEKITNLPFYILFFTGKSYTWRTPHHTAWLINAGACTAPIYLSPFHSSFSIKYKSTRYHLIPTGWHGSRFLAWLLKIPCQQIGQT